MHMTDRSAARRLRSISGRAREGARKQISSKVQAYLAGEPLDCRAEVPSSEVLAPGIERRRFSRRKVASEAQVRRVGGFSFEVALVDISADGCKVEMLEPCQEGDTAITRFRHLEPLGSRVCWVSGTTTGMQFSTPIHPAVFDMLLGRLTGEIAA